MKGKLKNGVLVLFGVGILLYLLVSAMMDLTNTKDVHTVTIKEAYDVLEMQHTVNGLIPIGTDYYYVGFDGSDSAYLIKASKKWLINNFDSDYQAKNTDGIQVKGLVKKIPNYQTKRELENRLSQVEGLVFPYGMLGCLNLNYIVIVILKLVDFLLFVVTFVIGLDVVKSREHNIGKPKLAKIGVFVLMAALVVLIGIIR